MKTGTIGAILFIVLFVGGIYGFVYLGISSHNKVIDNCKSLGEKKSLEYYSHTDCGWKYKDCAYMCKYINQDGKVVLKPLQ